MRLKLSVSSPSSAKADGFRYQNELVSPEQITGLYLERRLMKTGMSEEEARAYARDYKTAFAEALKSMIPVGGKGIVKYQGMKMCFERTCRDTFEVYRV